MEQERNTVTSNHDANDAVVALPDQWCWAQLGDIAEVIGGNSPASSSYNQDQRGVPLINGPTEFGPGPLDSPTIAQYTDDPTRFCEKGDLLVCVRGSTGRTNVASFRAAIGRGIAAIRAPECQVYINYYVAAQADYLLSIGTGTTFSSISLDQLRSLKIPLPPVSEQARIVEALSQSLAEIDLGIQSLQRARANLTHLRAAVLRSAITGGLTENARRVLSHTPAKSEPDLITQLASARRASASSTPQESLFDHRVTVRLRLLFQTIRSLLDGLGSPLANFAKFSSDEPRAPASGQIITRRSISEPQILRTTVSIFLIC